MIREMQERGLQELGSANLSRLRASTTELGIIDIIAVTEVVTVSNPTGIISTTRRGNLCRSGASSSCIASIIARKVASEGDSSASDRVEVFVGRNKRSAAALSVEIAEYGVSTNLGRQKGVWSMQAI